MTQVSDIKWGQTHCALCGKKKAGTAEGDAWGEAEDANDKERMKELDAIYCWLDYAGEPCSSKEADQIVIELRQEYDALRESVEGLLVMLRLESHTLPMLEACHVVERTIQEIAERHTSAA